MYRVQQVALPEACERLLSPSSHPDDLSVGSRLGHYNVTALIGEGGMGRVRI